MELNYKKDLEIDQDALDEEWIRQPSLMMEYNEEAQIAKDRVATLKRKLEVSMSEVDLDIRSNPKAFSDVLPADSKGEPKVTEGAVKAAVQLDEDVEKLNSKLLSATHEYNMISAACRAMEVKKSALENLVKLHGQNYFASPNADMEGDAALKEKRRDRVQSEVKETLKKKRRRRSD